MKLIRCRSWYPLIPTFLGTCLFRTNSLGTARAAVRPALMGISLWLLLVGPSFAACVEQSASSPPSPTKDISGDELDRRILEAERSLRIGYRQRAIDLLNVAANVARQRDDVRREAISLGALGNAYLASNLSFKARQCLDESLAKARDPENEDLLPLIHLNLYNYRATIGGDRQGADASFVEAIDAAEKAGRTDIVVKARLNRAYLQAKRSSTDKAATEAVVEDLGLAERDIVLIESDLERASLWLALGSRWLELSLADAIEDDISLRAYSAISAARDLALELERPDIEASSLGALGQLYQHAGRTEAALSLYRQAETIVRLSKTPNAAYPWSWRIGRLLQQMEDRRGAIEAYQQAVDMTEAIRRSTSDVQGHRDFTPTVLDDTQTLLSEYLELLFDDDVSDQWGLNNIRGLVEQQREIEVQTFFQDDCIADLRSRVTTIAPRLGSQTALIYPVPLREKWILLVEIDGRLESVKLNVTPSALASQVKAFRDALKRDGEAIARKEADRNRYLEPSKALYRMVLERVSSILRQHNINTIVFVPTGPFRSIPLAALHDGTDFLVRDYAIATLPGLSLLDFREPSGSSIRALVGGLTEASLDFDPLPNVTREVDNIRRSIPEGADLLGAEFVPDVLQRRLDVDPYTIVHIASHAEIGASAADSFVVAHGDKKLDLDRLEVLLKSSQYRDQPVELLTLSACQTADGKDLNRAALGLAGIAVKAGARSALGTLWPVFDKSSPALMDAFYATLTSGNRLTKAKALQQAQLALLENHDFDHPFFWAPYLLIGNWL